MALRKVAKFVKQMRARLAARAAAKAKEAAMAAVREYEAAAKALRAESGDLTPVASRAGKHADLCGTPCLPSAHCYLNHTLVYQYATPLPLLSAHLLRPIALSRHPLR